MNPEPTSKTPAEDEGTDDPVATPHVVTAADSPTPDVVGTDVEPDVAAMRADLSEEGGA